MQIVTQLALYDKQGINISAYNTAGKLVMPSAHWQQEAR